MNHSEDFGRVTWAGTRWRQGGKKFPLVNNFMVIAGCQDDINSRFANNTRAGSVSLYFTKMEISSIN